MNNIEYRALLDLLMCSDPWPVVDTGYGDGHEQMIAFADAEAKKRGYENWIVAYHEHKTITQMLKALPVIGVLNVDNPADPRNKEWAGNAELICGFCGKPGADKIPHPVRWPNENSAGTKYVHAACEDAECRRAHSLLSDKERESFLRTV